MEFFFANSLLSLWAPALVILLLFTVAGRWVALRRMGRRRWAALVPALSTYEVCKGASGSRTLEVVATAVDAAAFLTALYTTFGSNLSTPATELLGAVLGWAWVVTQLVVAQRLAAAFGKGFGHAALLVILPVIGYPLLTLENSVYLGPVDLPRP